MAGFESHSLRHIFNQLQTTKSLRSCRSPRSGGEETFVPLLVAAGHLRMSIHKPDCVWELSSIPSLRLEGGLRRQLNRPIVRRCQPWPDNATLSPVDVTKKA